MSLRAILMATTVLVVVLAAALSATLVLETRALERSVTNIADTVESVRLAEEAEVDLLLRERTDDLVVKRDLETQLRGSLVTARKYVTSAEEAIALREAEAFVDAHLRSTQHGTAARDASEQLAYSALERLVDVNVARAKRAEDEAHSVDRLASALGIGLGVALLVVAAALIGWLRKRAFEPLFVLASAMERFGRGDREVRASERGPAELSDMSRRFNEMATALSSQRQAQITFLGGIAHDLRNPLSALRLAVDLVDPDEPLPPEPRVRHTFELVRRQIGRLERMVGDFLDMAKIEAGQLQLELSPQDGRALVGQVVDLLDGAAGHQLDVELPDHPVFIRCDSLRIEQALTNLVGNAIKYSPAGTAVKISLAERGEEVILQVTDQGIGIARDDLQRIFEPFRRGAAKDTVSGVGLGLFNARKIIEAHHGRIEVESAISRGSTFRICLPALREDPAAPAAAT